MSETKPNTGEQETARQLLQLVAGLASELHPDNPSPLNVRLSSRLDADLAFDSLGRVELIHRVETTFGVTLAETAFASVETVADLLDAVLAGESGKPLFDRRSLADLSLAEVDEMPERAQTLVEVLEWHLKRHGQRPLVELYSDTGQGEVISYAHLAGTANRVAWCLLDKQLEPGARVTLMLPTGGDYFFSFMGVLVAGMVPVPIYPPVRLSQIESYIKRHRSILQNCRAEVMITTPAIARYSALLKSLVPSIRHVLSPDDFARYDERPVKLAHKPDDIAFIQYTSGSTADPKGVQLSHANLLANIRAMGKAARVSSKDVFVSWLPLYHDMGLIGACLGMFYHAGYLVVMSPLEFLARPERWLWAVHRYRATLSAAPNFAYDLCLHRIPEAALKGLELSSWRLACNGAEPVIPETVRGFCSRFAAYGFRPEAYWPVYGLAESSVGLAFPRPGQVPEIERIKRREFTQKGIAIKASDDEEHALEFVCCGQVLPDHEIRVVDDLDKELPDRRQGHLQFRGPSATSGYLSAPDKTAELYHGQWLDSGDLAYIDGGKLYLTGRSKDIIIRAGRNIYPHEIEEAVGTLPDVRRGRVVAFGYQQQNSGPERLAVLAETRLTDPEAQRLLREGIIEACAELIDLPPDKVILAPPGTILKTSSGKLRRSACRELYLRGKVGKKPPPVWWQLGKVFVGASGEQLKKQAGKLKTLAFAGYAWTLFLLAAMLACPLLLLLPNHALRQRMASAACRFLALASATPVRVNGLDKLPKGQSCIYVANHCSYLDAYILLASVPGPYKFVAKAELANNRLLAFLLGRLGVEFVERFDIKKSVEDAALVGSKKGSLLYFPEGTFTRRPGLAPFHMGAFLAAAQTARPVVPVAIRGSRSMLRDSDWFPRSGRIEVTVCEPLASASSEDPWQTANALKNRARTEILRYCGEPDLDVE